ncbi:hypothetical protein SB748_30510, partial [Rhizobium sp. SIMBA_035]
TGASGATGAARGLAPAAASGARATGTTGNNIGADNAEPAGNSFDARQKVLDQRTEENNYRYAVAEHDCYSKFLVNYCRGKARDKMRVVQADIRKEQLALDGEQRAERARQ